MKSRTELEQNLQKAHTVFLGKTVKVYDALKRMRIFADSLHEMKELDQWTGSLSSNYIQSIKNHSDIQEADLKIKNIVNKIEQGFLVLHVEKIERLMAVLSETKPDALERFLTSVDFQDVPDEEQSDRGESALLREIAFCETFIQRTHGNLLNEARGQAGTNGWTLKILGDDLKKAVKKITSFTDEIQRLNNLLAERKQLLTEAIKVRLGDVHIYKENEKTIQEKNTEIEKLRDKVLIARQEVDASIQFATIFENKDNENIFGTNYLQLKENYLSNIQPAYSAAVNNAGILLTQLGNHPDELHKEFIQQLENAEKEAKERQEELISAELGQVLKPLAEEYTKLQDSCLSHARIFKQLSEKKEGASSISGLKLKQDLAKSAAATGKMFASFSEKQALVPVDMRNSKTHREISENVKRSRQQFLAQRQVPVADVAGLVKIADTRASP